MDVLTSSNTWQTEPIPVVPFAQDRGKASNLLTFSHFPKGGLLRLYESRQFTLQYPAGAQFIERFKDEDVAYLRFLLPVQNHQTISISVEIHPYQQDTLKHAHTAYEAIPSITNEQYNVPPAYIAARAIQGHRSRKRFYDGGHAFMVIDNAHIQTLYGIFHFRFAADPEIYEAYRWFFDGIMLSLQLE